MHEKSIYERVWFETVDAGAESVTQTVEAEMVAVASIMAEVRAGRHNVDVERAILAELRRVDKAHGRAADSLLARIAAGDAPIFMSDLELVVTLGGGRRKTWYYVDADDLDSMNELRFKNYRNARESFQTFNGNVIAVRPAVVQYGMLGLAAEAGAFGEYKAAA